MRLAWWVTVAWVVGCGATETREVASGGGGGTDDAPTGSGGSPAQSGGGGGASSAGGMGGESTSSAGGGAVDPICLPACSTPADCNLGTAPFDADNYTCEGGACRYQGCNSDTECQALSLVCRPFGALGGATDICVKACSTVADCAQPSAPYDDDNYTCDNGGCRFLGCNSDTECEELGNYACRDLGSGVSYCQPTCDTPADCDLDAGPVYDEDNYSCEEGVCVYTGCHAGECSALGNYTCVE